MCGVCERIKETKAGDNPFLVKELETGFVVMGDFQHFKGYTLFLYKDHVVELFDLDEETRAKHLYEMTVVAQAVKNAFGAEKMNYECLGNGEGGAHIHWHLFPRRAGDIATCYSNAEKAERELGWKAEFGLEEMFRRTIESMKYVYREENPEKT